MIPITVYLDSGKNKSGDYEWDIPVPMFIWRIPEIRMWDYGTHLDEAKWTCNNPCLGKGVTGWFYIEKRDPFRYKKWPEPVVYPPEPFVRTGFHRYTKRKESYSPPIFPVPIAYFFDEGATTPFLQLENFERLFIMPDSTGNFGNRRHWGLVLRPSACCPASRNWVNWS